MLITVLNNLEHFNGTLRGGGETISSTSAIINMVYTAFELFYLRHSWKHRKIWEHEATGEIQNG